MLLVALAAALSLDTLLRSTVTSSDPMFGPDPAAPTAAPGLWAASAEDCPEADGPAGLDPTLAGWPDCARPVRIERESVGLVSPAPDGAGPPVRRLATHYALAPAWPGSPAVVQLEVPGLLDTTFTYAALEVQASDPSGRFTRARMWPIGCPGRGVAGVGASGNGCEASTPTGIHEAARTARPGPVLTLRWVAP